MLKISRIQPNQVMIAIIAISMVMGIFIVDDYGINVDTLGVIAYGKSSLDSYSPNMISNPLLVKDRLKVIYEPIGDNINNNLRFYGPAFQIITEMVNQFIAKFNPTVDPILVHKYLIFVTFLIGMWYLYVLCKRYVKGWIPVIIALSFYSQPLLFGHSLINSKDAPFMNLFIASVAIGFNMVDLFSKNIRVTKENEHETDRGELKNVFINEVRSLTNHEKRKTGLIAAGWITFMAIIGFSFQSLKDFVANLVTTLYNAPTSSFFGQLFARMATNKDALHVELYISKGLEVFNRLLIYGIIVVSVFLILAFIRRLQGVSTFLTLELKRFIKYTYQLPKTLLSIITNKHFLFAGIILGLTISIRNLGIAAGGIVGLILLKRFKEKAIAPAIIYATITILTTIASWPYLWYDPLDVFKRSMKLMSNHSWHGWVLFNGALYRPVDLPISYLPKLIFYKLTIPIIVLSIIGFIIFAIRKNKNREFELLLISLWFLLPLAYVMISTPTVYDNIRQFLFILPPLFIFAGIGLNWINEKFRFSWIFPILAGIVILPGIVGIIDLHPYEYIYYNRFIGGIDGAYRYYENDYWDTSFKESMAYINKNAPPDSKVVVWGGTTVARYYAREDLEIIIPKQLEINEKYEYALLHTRKNTDLQNARGGELVFSVSIRDVDLSIVKEFK